VSVTFTTAFDESAPQVFTIECADGVRRETRTGDYGAIAALYSAHQLNCENEECRTYGPSLEMVGEFGPEVNVTNLNARLLLNALGLEGGLDLTGGCDAGDFLGRVLIALAIAPPDEGVPSHRMVPGETSPFGNVVEGGATMINCGRSEGYLQERLVELEAVARWALAEGREVTWA
jgi:hypothetical protein